MSIYLILGVIALGLMLIFFSRLTTVLYSRSRTFSSGEVQARRAAIVFGAGLGRDGTPTQILRDRVATAVDLYFSGRVEKILMSGDNRFVEYNEPAAMKEYALSLGVPAQVIVLDYAGRRTYDTCYRAKAIFGLSQVILITQKFHLPRALYTCNMLGLSAIGVVADRRVYRWIPMLYWNLRELFATTAALWDVFVLHPLPVLGDPEPIFPEES